jgi:hypothetical protein
MYISFNASHKSKIIHILHRPTPSGREVTQVKRRKKEERKKDKNDIKSGNLVPCSTCKPLKPKCRWIRQGLVTSKQAIQTSDTLTLKRVEINGS